MKRIITFAFVISIIIILFFVKMDYKLFKFGNNMNNQSADKIKKYILDMNSYEVIANITIKSNKNTNNYVIKEQYIKDNNMFKIQILEPKNVKDISFMYDGTNLKINNSNLNLNKIYENYQYVGESDITLISFIKDYLESDESSLLEEKDKIILKTRTKNGNKYVAYKKLYIDKNTANPIEMEIQDITQKTRIYILYNEVKINNLQKEDILAFKLKNVVIDI